MCCRGAASTDNGRRLHETHRAEAVLKPKAFPLRAGLLLQQHVRGPRGPPFCHLRPFAVRASVAAATHPLAPPPFHDQHQRSITRHTSNMTPKREILNHVQMRQFNPAKTNFQFSNCAMQSAMKIFGRFQRLWPSAQAKFEHFSLGGLQQVEDGVATSPRTPPKRIDR